MSNKNISAGTIARTLVLLLALVNQILSVSGHSVLPIDDAQIETLVTTAWTVVAAVIAWWKNSSFTSAAVLADQVMKSVKAGTVSAEDVKAVVDSEVAQG